MLDFILKKKWYEKIKSGEKTVEYREFTEKELEAIFLKKKKAMIKHGRH